ncbi:hypothetical protein TIFTF001_033225 [Ficus carica]|uniref:Uncharacterized protein n=1 Tax=Ficus carica TaxID=3494 RepID=A0AA88DYG4_FICCA|nr:hypothetical protein TIFTF001_033225 [Ficus carica]
MADDRPGQISTVMVVLLAKWSTLESLRRWQRCSPTTDSNDEEWRRRITTTTRLLQMTSQIPTVRRCGSLAIHLWAPGAWRSSGSVSFKRSAAFKRIFSGTLLHRSSSSLFFSGDGRGGCGYFNFLEFPIWEFSI